MHAALVHRWHLHIIEDLIDDDNNIILFVCLIWGSGSVAFTYSYVDIQQPGCI